MLESILDQIVPISFGLAVVVFFIWLIVPSAQGKPFMSGDGNEPFIDPEDSYQIGLLVGLTGGTIPDAALMRFALQRFQEVHGRRARSSDIGVVLGLIRSVHTP